MTISIDALKSMSVIELQQLGDEIHRTMVRQKLRGQELQSALDYLQAIEDEIRTRPLPSSLEQACGELEPADDLQLTWSPTALSDAEAAINQYCQKHGMTYAEFRQKVDRWLERQDKPQAAKLLPRMRRRLEHGMG